MSTFGSPLWLLFLLLLPLGMGVLLLRVRRDAARRHRYASPRLLARAGVLGDGAAVLVRGLILLLASSLLVLALATSGPGSGSGTRGPLGGRLAVVLDVSKSMEAQDMPGGRRRLEAARSLAEGVLEEVTGTRVCSVFFAGEARVVCPLTTDTSAAAILIERPDLALTPGTDLQKALGAARTALRGRGRILLLTDGEELAGHALQAVSRDTPVYAVGFGSLAGAPIPEGHDSWGAPLYHQFHGQTVITALHQDLLARLAEQSGGRYYAGDAPGLVTTLSRALSGPAAAPTGVPGVVQPFQSAAIQPLVILALLLLVLDGLGAPMERWRRFKVRPGRAVVLVLGLSQLAWTWPWVPLTANRAGFSALQAGHAQEAAADFRQSMAETRDFRPAYDLGEALYDMGNYQAAEGAFREALQRVGAEGPRAFILYDLGNALYREAQASGDARGFASAANAYRAALALTPDDADAAHNLALAERQARNQAPRNGQATGSAGGARGSRTTAASSAPAPAQALPSRAEVDSVLQALQADERARAESEHPRATTPDQAASRILAQLLPDRPAGQNPDTPDW